MTAATRMVPCICCGQLTPMDPAGYLASLPMSQHQRRIANRLAADFGKYVTTESLIYALYFDHPDGGAMTAGKVVDQEIVWLRRLLLLSPLAIETANRTSGNGGRRLVWREASAA